MMVSLIFFAARLLVACVDSRPDFAFYVNKNGWRSRKDFMVHWEGSPTGFGESIIDSTSEGVTLMTLVALHYPYVLAFEPTFVEIRHVETGFMSQVIQGNNLRLLFADTPPSTTNTASQFNQHPMGYGPAPGYPSPGGSVNSRHSGQNQSPYGQSGFPGQPGFGAGGAGPQGPYGRSLIGGGRDEILMVSDDRVLSLRTTMGQGQAPFSDSASMVSVAR
jgi:hypothetical protein